jgi:hypothetical protein
MPFAPAVVERTMKVQEVLMRAISGQLTWLQAENILGGSPAPGGSSPRPAAGFVYRVVNEKTGRRELGRRMHDLRRPAARDRADDGTPERVSWR